MSDARAPRPDLLPHVEAIARTFRLDARRLRMELERLIPRMIQDAEASRENGRKGGRPANPMVSEVISVATALRFFAPANADMIGTVAGASEPASAPTRYDIDAEIRATYAKLPEAVDRAAERLGLNPEKKRKLLRAARGRVQSPSYRRALEADPAGPDDEDDGWPYE